MFLKAFISVLGPGKLWIFGVKLIVSCIHLESENIVLLVLALATIHLQQQDIHLYGKMFFVKCTYKRMS